MEDIDIVENSSNLNEEATTSSIDYWYFKKFNMKQHSDPNYTPCPIISEKIGLLHSKLYFCGATPRGSPPFLNGGYGPGTSYVTHSKTAISYFWNKFPPINLERDSSSPVLCANLPFAISNWTVWRKDRQVLQKWSSAAVQADGDIKADGDGVREPLKGEGCTRVGVRGVPDHPGYKHGHHAGEDQHHHEGLHHTRPSYLRPSWCLNGSRIGCVWCRQVFVFSPEDCWDLV